MHLKWFECVVTFLLLFNIQIDILYFIFLAFYLCVCVCVLQRIFVSDLLLFAVGVGTTFFFQYKIGDCDAAAVSQSQFGVLVLDSFV